MDAKKAGYWFSTSELQVADIKSNLFTHLYAGFAKVQFPKKDADVIKFPDNSGRSFKSFSKTVKGTNPSVKTLLCIGGEGQDISSAIASVAKDDTLREAFINSSIQLARENKYDGLDLCWLYPSNAEQMRLFAKLLEQWRLAINGEKPKQTNNYEKLLLTAAVFHHPVIHGTDGNNIDYPCQAISMYLDWINVLTIDFDTPSPSNSPGKTGPVDAWLSGGKAGIKDWIKQKVPTKNLILGLPFHVYNLVNDHDHDDIATKVKELVRRKKLGGYFAWHLASNDDKQTLLNAASNAVRNARNVTAGHQQNSHHHDFGIGDRSTIGTVYNVGNIGTVDKIGGNSTVDNRNSTVNNRSA